MVLIVLYGTIFFLTNEEEKQLLIRIHLYLKHIKYTANICVYIFTML